MYQKFYKLKQMPFQLTPDPEMLYISHGHKNALSYLEYGLLQGEGFVVLTGEIGAGKTTLIRSLLNQLDKKEVAATSMTAGNLDSHGTLAMIASSFGLPIESKSKVALIKDIKNLLNDYTKKKRRALLIVDEAQTLTPESLEELRMLSNTEIDGRAAIQIFLVGQDELKTTLLSSEFEHLRQRVIASCHLNALNQNETKDYIIHRLTKSGWKNDPEIDDDVFHMVFIWSSGIPRRINLLCDRLFLFGFTSDLHALSKNDIEQVIQDVETELSGNAAAGEQISRLSSQMNEMNKSYNNISIPDLNLRSVMILNETLANIEARLSELVELQREQNKIMANKK